jgi:hypothetical protein
MSLAELSLSLRLDTSRRVVFVLDASESCRDEQGRVVSLVQEVLGRLPSGLGSSIYFLGNPHAYPAEEFERNASRWFEENHGRASVIRPVIGSLVHGGYDRVAIVGSGTIYDLQDWLDTETRAKILLVAVGEPMCSDDGALAGCRAEAGEVAAALYDPLSEARISGRGFMPLRWSNAGYEVELEEGGVALAARGLEDYGIELRCFAEQGAGLRCLVTHASGKRVDHRFEHVALAEEKTARGAVLNAKEAAAFQRAAQREDYVCPLCGSPHPWRTLQCIQDAGYSILGTSIYRSLTKNNIAGLVLFTRRKDGSVYCRRCESPVLRISASSIVLQRGADVSLWRWADERRSWRSARASLEPYHQLGDGSHVVFLR